MKNVHPYRDGSRRHRPESTNGYTLVELVVVLSIIAALTTLTVGAYLSMGRVSSVEAATQTFSASIDFTKNWAVARRTPAKMAFFNDETHGYYTISTLSNDTHTSSFITPTNHLPRPIVFDYPSATSLLFTARGHADWDPETDTEFTIILREMGPPEGMAFSSTITISRATGYIGVTP